MDGAAGAAANGLQAFGENAAAAADDVDKLIGKLQAFTDQQTAMNRYQGALDSPRGAIVTTSAQGTLLFDQNGLSGDSLTVGGMPAFPAAMITRMIAEAIRSGQAEELIGELRGVVMGAIARSETGIILQRMMTEGLVPGFVLELKRALGVPQYGT